MKKIRYKQVILSGFEGNLINIRMFSSCFVTYYQLVLLWTLGSLGTDVNNYFFIKGKYWNCEKNLTPDFDGNTCFNLSDFILNIFAMISVCVYVCMLIYPIIPERIIILRWNVVYKVISAY